MKTSFPLLLAFASLLLGAAAQAQPTASDNPPLPDFNLAGSDPKAVQIADEVMAAQGGRRNWDATRYLAWNFFGVRNLTWDKYTGNVRVDYLKNDTKVMVNVNDLKGKVFKDGAEVTQPDSLKKYLTEGRNAWINDSYWLVMPFKLKDSGVTLKYLGEDTTQTGERADVLQLTFQNVGVTPENGYRVYVDKGTRLVSQFAYYKKADNPAPDFVMPWKNYQTYGKIKLSGDRGQRKLTDIKVMDKMPESVFTAF